MKQAAVPLLLPLLDKLGKPLCDAQRLIYFNTLTVYYSYQYPIAYLSDTQLMCRDRYWDRRRGRRALHIEYIMDDVRRQCGEYKANTTTNFIEDLYMALAKIEVKTNTNAPTHKKADCNKRRVLL